MRNYGDFRQFVNKYLPYTHKYTHDDYGYLNILKSIDEFLLNPYDSYRYQEIYFMDTSGMRL